MIFFNGIFNIDLLAVGVTTAAIGILGFIAFFSNTKNASNRAFLALAIFTVLYSIVNYVSYRLTTPILTLWFLRGTIFFATWHAFSFLHFAYVFPKEKFEYKWFDKWLIVPFVAIVSGLTLSPLMFASIAKQGGAGSASQATLGPAIALFGLTVLALVLVALTLLIKNTIRATGLEKKQFIFVLIGAAITFVLLMTFNVFYPIVLQWVRYIPLTALFFFPFIAFTTYAIVKHHLLDSKVISTEILAFVLAIVTLSEVVLSQGLLEILFRAGEFLLVLIFGILLIKNVLREVEQREELERLNKEIAEKNAKLEELSRFKSELLSLASHQMRSPLAAIKGFISLIIEGSYGAIDPKVKVTLEKVKSSTNELITLINTLLDVRRVEEGRMEYQFAKVDVRKIASEVVEALAPLAVDKKLEFTFNGPEKEIFVNADLQKLKQVVQNLVDNALKYTPSGFVHVILKEEGGKVIISVADSGLGIPATLIPYLFEEFIRDERVKKDIRGTGLGLYIAKKITEAHGGTIVATSDGEGKGSVFNIILPEMA